MPLTPIKYENASIYKICCNDPNITDCYVGSTTNIIKRRQKHKYCCNNEKSRDCNMYVYQFIRENGGWDNWSLILIENFSCQNKLELEKRERYYIEELKATLNKIIPTRSQKEYRKENKEQIKEYQKEYRLKNNDKRKEIDEKYFLDNRDKILEKNKEKIVCECGCEVVKCALSRHKKSSKHQGRMLLP